MSPQHPPPFHAKRHMGRALALLLVSQVGLLQHVLALVAEDQVRSLGVAALVRAEHDVVRRGVSERLGVAELWADLDVAAAALDVLLILGLVLDDQLLAGVAEGVKARGEAEEAGVLGGLHALVLRLVAEPRVLPASFMSHPERPCGAVRHPAAYSREGN